MYYYTRPGPDPYLAGRATPTIARVKFSRPSGAVMVQALFAYPADGTPVPGDYITGGTDGDEPRGARTGFWSSRTPAHAETLLLRRGWRVVTVADARERLEAAGFTLYPAMPDRGQLDIIQADEDGAATWRAPRLEIERPYSLSAFAVAVEPVRDVPADDVLRALTPALWAGLIPAGVDALPLVLEAARVYGRPSVDTMAERVALMGDAWVTALGRHGITATNPHRAR